MNDSPAPDEVRSGASCGDHAQPWQQGMLQVGDGHAIWFGQYGNPDGMPLLFLHGGPGSGCSPRHPGLFDASRFRIVMFDQRGCGRSTPRGALAANTTADLVADVERLRHHLSIGRWLVSGGSWGSTLALAWCASHRDACLGAVLRGIFLARRSDIDWFFDGAATLQPIAHARLAACLPGGGRLAERIFAAVLGDDHAHARDVVRHWMQWEESLTHGQPAPLPRLDAAGAVRALDKYRVQAHYLRHDGFLAAGEWQRQAAALAGLPIILLHGRRDAVCRAEGALALHRHLPGSRLAWVDGAGHDPFAPAMRAALHNACTALSQQRGPLARASMYFATAFRSRASQER